MWWWLDEAGRDGVLGKFMRWAWFCHEVRIVLLRRGPGVVVGGLTSDQPGRGHARVALAVLCDWADCARIRLELTPTDRYGADLGRLTRFCASLGFGGDLDASPNPGLMLVRYPAPEPAMVFVGRAIVPRSVP